MKIMFVPLLVFWLCIVSCYNGKSAFTKMPKVGEQLIYSYASEGTGYSDLQMLYNIDSTVKAISFFYRPSLQTTQVNIRCNIRKTIIASAGDSVHVCFEIETPDVKIATDFLPLDAAAIAKEMTMPVFADMTFSGKILSIKTDSSVSYLTAGLIKNMLSNTQVVLPQEKVDNWQTTEENNVGFFTADYSVVRQDKDSIEYGKTNKGYEKIRAAKKGQTFLPDSKTMVVVDASGAVRRIKTSESLITLVGADTVVASGSSTEYQLLSVKNIGEKNLPAFAQLENSGTYLESTALSDPISDEEINRLAYKNTLSDDNFETLTAKLQRVNGEGGQYESDLVKKFRALAWLSENDCSKMAALLTKATAASDTFRMMSHALAAVETPFAINQLAVVAAARKNDDAVMMELLPVLATTTTPTGNAADVVSGLAFSQNTTAFTSTTAQLALGGMVKNLMRTDQKKADELTDLIIKNMKDSRDTLQQILVYGNTGSFRLLPVLTSYISGSSVSAEIRAAAVFATRLIDHREVGALLNKLAVDKDSVLSKAAKETIEFRTDFFREKL